MTISIFVWLFVLTQLFLINVYDNYKIIYLFKTKLSLYGIINTGNSKESTAKEKQKLLFQFF